MGVLFFGWFCGVMRIAFGHQIGKWGVKFFLLFFMSVLFELLSVIIF